MRILISSLAETQTGPWGTVLVVGAGSGAQLPLLRRLEPTRMLLCEAHPEQARRLAATIDPASGEELIEGVVMDHEQSHATLHLCGHPAFASLRAPTRLLDLLPNLRPSGEHRVAALSLRAIVADRGIDPAARNLLVVDAPGQLAALRDLHGLRGFTDILVKAGVDALYEGDASAPELHGALADAGFDAVATDPEAIYPFAVHAFRRNDARLALESARRDHAAELARQAEAHATALAAQAREREVEKAEALDALEAELQRVRGQVAEGQARLAELDGQGKHLEQEKLQLVRDLEQRTSERDGAATRSVEDRKQLERLKERLNHIDNQLVGTRDAMALAVRLQTLRENDLEDMRQRYAVLHGAHQAQRALLAKLSKRLVAANEYFQQLAGSGMITMEGAASLQARPVEKPRRRKAARKAGIPPS